MKVPTSRICTDFVEDLAAYEEYRARLRTNAEGIAKFGFAEENKLILAEERSFLRKVT